MSYSDTLKENIGRKNPISQPCHNVLKSDHHGGMKTEVKTSGQTAVIDNHKKHFPLHRRSTYNQKDLQITERSANYSNIVFLEGPKVQNLRRESRNNVPTQDSSSQFKSNHVDYKCGSTIEVDCADTWNRKHSKGDSIIQDSKSSSSKMHDTRKDFSVPSANQCSKNMLNPTLSNHSHKNSKKSPNHGYLKNNKIVVKSEDEHCFDSTFHCCEEIGARNKETDITIKLVGPESPNNEFTSTNIQSKKKGRAKKAKRIRALQMGKLHIMSPEVHTKVASQLKSDTPKFEKSHETGFSDINNISDYPELPSRNQARKSPNSNNLHKLQRPSSENEVSHLNTPESYAALVCSSSVKAKPVSKDSSHSEADTMKLPRAETKVKSSSAKKYLKPCPFDLVQLSALIPEIRTDVGKEIEHVATNGLKQTKGNKVHRNIHGINALDSTAPIIKRGKEREKPKPKKPTPLKKIILLERQSKKNGDFLKENIHDSEVTNSELGSLENKLEVFYDDSNLEAEKLATHCKLKEETTTEPSIQLDQDEEQLMCNNNLSDSLFTNCNDSKRCFSPEVSFKKEIVFPILDNEERTNYMINCAKEIANVDVKCSQQVELTNENISPGECGNMSEMKSSFAPPENLTNVCQNIQENLEIEVRDLKNPSESSSSYENHTKTIDVLSSAVRSLYLIKGIKFDATNEMDKKILKAVHVVLHTKNFREYCYNFLSTELNELVASLLRTLYRFQDRVYKKDAQKAFVKRRFLFGIKEVTKSINSKKLKFVFVAPNIQDIKAEGGLNDALTTLLRLCNDHHVPCIFAGERKYLGKVCCKPVPISCIGVFNYAGTEAVFHNIMKCVEESRKDYAQIFKMLKSTISVADVTNLIQAWENAAPNITLLRQRVLKLAFQQTSSADITSSCKSYLDFTEKYIVRL